MMVLPHTRFRRQLIRAIVLPIVLLLFLSSISIGQISGLLSALHWVDRTDQVLAQTHHIQKLLLDRETGLRGYLLSGQQNFLEPYEQANAQIESSFTELQRLVADSPTQARRVAALIAQAQQWQQYALPALQRRQQGDPEPLSALERRKQLMDEIRRQIDQFTATETQLRDQRSRRAQQTTRTVILTSLLLALGVGAVLAYVLRRQLLQVSRTYETALQTAQDRTQEAQQAAAALQQYKDIFQFAEHGLVVETADNQTLMLMNPAFARMHGYRVKDLEGKPILDLFPGERHAEAVEFIRRVNECGYDAIESQHCRSDGTVFPVFLSGTAVRDKTGTLLYRIVSVHNITEHQQTQLALQRSAQRLAVLHDIDRAILAAEADAAVIGSALSQLRQIVPHRQAFVTMFDLETGAAQVVVASSSTGELSHPPGTDLSAADFAPEQRLLVERRYADDLASLATATAPPIWKQLRAHGFGSCLCVPLLVENTLIGELNLAATEAYAFDDEAQDIVSEVANQLAIALQQSRLRHDLETTNQQLRATFNQAAVGIAHVSPSGQWLQVNQKLCDIVGYSREELLQRTFQEITYAEDLDLDLDLDYVRQMLAGEIQTYTLEKRYIRKDQSLIWINLTAALVRDADGQPNYFISVIEDIHDRKLAQLNEQFLADLDLRLRQLTRADAMAWEAVSRIGEFLQVSRCSWGQVVGNEDMVVLGEDWRQQGVPSVAGVYQLADFFLPAQLAQLQRGETVVVSDVFTHPYTAPFAQNYVPLQVLAYVTVPCIVERQWVALLHVHETTARQWRPDEVTLLQEVVARLWSIIAQTETLQTLRDREERIRLATEAAQLGMWFWDLPQDELTWTERCKAMFGLPPDAEMSYEIFLNTLHPDDRERTHTAVTQALAHKGEYHVEFRVLWSDGSIHWIAARGQAYADASGTPARVMGTVQDISERKQAEAALQQLNATLEQRVAERTAQLEETNQELEAFTYSVSHDLRAPLRTIQGFAAALLEDCGSQLEDDCRHYIDSIIDDAMQMNGLISDLLNYSRLTRAQIHLQPTSLETVVEDALKQLTTPIQDKQAQIRIAAPLPPVIAHRSTLVQVVVNLLSNAIKFVPSKTHPEIDIFATIERQDDHDWIRLWIKDNGIGIAPEHQERIFRVFERLHGIETYPGTGIGLAIVRKGLERMGGRAGVDSHLGQGSRFWIALPKAVLPLDAHYDPPPANSAH